MTGDWMADVEIFEFVEGSGEQVDRATAAIGEVQHGLDQIAHAVAANAEAYLESIRADPNYTGSWKSYVTVESGDIDRFVIYSDDRDKNAAWAIEFHKPGYNILSGAAEEVAAATGVSYERWV